MVEKILNSTTPYGQIRASHEGSLHSSTLNQDTGLIIPLLYLNLDYQISTKERDFGNLIMHSCKINALLKM